VVQALLEARTRHPSWGREEALGVSFRAPSRFQGSVSWKGIWCERLDVACQKCDRRTKHFILKSCDRTGSDDFKGGFSIDWSQSFQIIQCQGCETLSFRMELWDSETSVAVTEDGDTEMCPTEQLFAHRVAGQAPIEDIHLLPDTVQRIYEESVASLNGRQPVLTGIGIRALIETICKEKGAAGGDLFSKINDLVTKAF
jgi:hypothetical protein